MAEYNRSFIIGLDLGQSSDPTAMAILEQFEDKKTYDKHYECRHLERIKLGTPYPAIVSRMVQITDTDELINNYSLVADMTGVGRPVVDLLREANLNVYGLTIRGGQGHTKDTGRTFTVSKRELVSVVQVVLQTGRLKIASSLPEATTLVNELLNFQVTVTEAMNDTYQGRQGVHDDLVLSVAMAAWYAESTYNWYST